MAATCMAVCKGSRKKIRGIFISSCHLPVAVECDIVILSEPGPIPQAPVGQFCRHNLSPRGDGNILRKPSCMRQRDTTYPREGTETIGQKKHGEKLRDTTYPREGTETLDWRGCPPAHRDTTYPREGTETQRAQSVSQRSSRHNLSPRGDGNPEGLYGRRAGLVDTTYPREGTETQFPQQLIN